MPNNETTTTGNINYTVTPALTVAAVKAVGDWRLDVLVVPFGSPSNTDSDGQYFDANTDIMHEAFSTPLAIYQHGVKQGAKGMQEKIIVVGDSVPGSLEKRADGWHVLVDLRQKVKEAGEIMKAAWKGLVAVSSDSISHLARLDVGGKMIQYEKNRRGRIAVWPLAGFSLWEMGNGNFQPANRQAMALPAFKAIYREAGLPFPDVANDTDGALSEAKFAAKRARVLADTTKLLKDIDKLFGDLK